MAVRRLWLLGRTGLAHSLLSSLGPGNLPPAVAHGVIVIRACSNAAFKAAGLVFKPPIRVLQVFNRMNVPTAEYSYTMLGQKRSSREELL